MAVRNIALGHFLRSRRERLQPQPDTLRSRRRTPGLRREDVAEAAGISSEWYIKLEQGRAACPSATTIDALAGALRLNATEHDHLRRIERGDGPPLFKREAVPASLKRLVASLEQPAYVTDERWDARAWNVAAVELLVDFSAIAVDDRNILLLMCTDERVKAVFGNEWREDAYAMVAMFRTGYDLHAGDPGFEGLVDRLRSSCPDFECWWRDHEVRNPSFRTKRLCTDSGELGFTSMTFQACHSPPFRLTVFMPTSRVASSA